MKLIVFKNLPRCGFCRKAEPIFTSEEFQSFCIENNIEYISAQWGSDVAKRWIRSLRISGSVPLPTVCIVGDSNKILKRFTFRTKLSVSSLINPIKSVCSSCTPGV